MPYRKHTTADLLHLARFVAPLALVQELERRGYVYLGHGRCRCVRSSYGRGAPSGEVSPPQTKTPA